MTQSEANYLKAIYKRSIINGDVMACEIAKDLDVSRPSVSRALNNLEDKSLIKRDISAFIFLTNKGLRQVRDIVYKEEMVSRYLSETLSVEKEKCRKYAEPLAFLIEGDILERIESIL